MYMYICCISFLLYNSSGQHDSIMKMNYEMNPLFKCMKLFLIYASLFSILFLNKYFLWNWIQCFKFTSSTPLRHIYYHYTYHNGKIIQSMIGKLTKWWLLYKSLFIIINNKTCTFTSRHDINQILLKVVFYKHKTLYIYKPNS
jgi:hypothetical protein